MNKEIDKEKSMDYEILTDDNYQFDYTFKIIVIGNAGNLLNLP